MKKFLTYQVFLVIILSIISSIFFGALLRQHYLKVSEEKYKSLKKIAVFFAEIPSVTKTMVINKTININRLPMLSRHKDKERFKQFINNNRNALLVLPRYDFNKNRSVVEIIDLKNFEILHIYEHDISEMNNKTKNLEEFPTLKLDNSPVRFLYRHPLILADGSLISNSNGPEFKIDICSNLKWINDNERFHHSLNLDHEGNIWQVGELKPYSKYVSMFNVPNFSDSALIKMNIEGDILYKKSVIELLIENKIFPKNFAYNASYDNNINPIHLNDIEPALSNSEYWKKGDVFLSIKNQSAVILYRPSSNKVINYITGPFARQHDVDIISKNQISIFNNNNFFDSNKYSEILIYNFEKKKFQKLINNQLKDENFKTSTNGLSHYFKDGALLVEEQNHGRLILFDKEGNKEWEYVNINKKNQVGYIKWVRIIEDEKFIEKFKLLLKKTTC